MKKLLLVAVTTGALFLGACSNENTEVDSKVSASATQEHKATSLDFVPNVKGTPRQLTCITIPSEENLVHFTLEETTIIAKTANADLPEVEGFTQQTVTYNVTNEDGSTMPEQISVPLEVFDKVEIGDAITLYKDNNFGGTVSSIKLDTLPELYAK